MKIGDTLIDTIMSDDDKSHVESIARRHDIQFLDHTVAMMIGARNGEPSLLANTVSFSVASSGGAQGLYLDPDEAETEDEAYFIALHELGHSILKHHRFDGGQSGSQASVDDEVAAWEWALTHAQRFPNDDTIEMIINALSTYTDGAEASARPESLLALAADPDIWKNNEWQFKTFKPLALSGMDPTPLINKDGVRRDVPQPYAKMLAEYIQYSVTYEREGFVANMRKTLADPDVAKRAGKVATSLGLNWEEMKDQLEKFDIS